MKGSRKRKLQLIKKLSVVTFLKGQFSSQNAKCFDISWIISQDSKGKFNFPRISFSNTSERGEMISPANENLRARFQKGAKTAHCSVCGPPFLFST